MTLPNSDNLPELLINGPPRADVTIALAHGAGAPMDSDFMEAFAVGLASHGLKVVRFEFPYMGERRRTGKRRPPNREPILRENWLRVIDAMAADRLIIGGKSLGGRMARVIADEAKVAGLVCLGYPFHPTGQPDKLRTEHLKAIKTATLIVQGERDPLGNKDEVSGYESSRDVKIRWLTDSDHSFKPRKKSGKTVEENWHEGIDAVAAFVSAL